MKKSIKMVVLALCVMFAVAFTASAKENKDITIGLAVANLQADFFNQIKQSVVAEADRIGVTVFTVDARGDSATQVNQIQDLITKEVDAIIYIPAGATAASVPVKAAQDAGIPVVTVDRNPDDAPGNTFIATDSVAAARVLGDWVVEQTNGKARIGVIQGQIGTTPEIARNKGFNEAIADEPGMEIVAKQASTMWMQDEGFKIAQDMLQRDPEINVFFGRADALALGAAQAVKVANLPHKVMIVGFDGDLAGLEAVEKGVLAATMTQQTQFMGRLAIRSAIDFINGVYVPATQLQNATLTTKDNVAKFIKVHP